MAITSLRNLPLSLVVSTVFFSGVAHSLEEERLWLPTSHQKLYLKLRDSAQAAENLNRCIKILDGTIDLAQSSQERPIFRILCRQPNGRTYNEMVDGLTLKTLTTPVEDPSELSDEERERRRLAEERRKQEEKEKRIESYWLACEAEFSQRTRLMSEVQRLGAEPPVPNSLDETSATFVLDFNAEGISGANLEFTAHCSIQDGEVQRFELSKRITVEAE